MKSRQRNGLTSEGAEERIYLVRRGETNAGKRLAESSGAAKNKVLIVDIAFIEENRQEIGGKTRFLS